MTPILRTISPLYLITFILAFCSIVYELLMAQSLTLLTGNSVLRYSTTIGLYLASMGIGAFLCTEKRRTRAVETLLKAEILLSIVGGSAVILLHFAHAIYAYYYVTTQLPLGRLVVFFTTSYGIIAVIGILTGFELPLLMHIREQEKEKTANVVLGVDYLGSLAGALLFPLVLLPSLGVLRTGVVTAMLNIVAALMLLFSKGVGTKRASAIFSVANMTVLYALIVLLAFSSAVNQHCLKRYYYYQESSLNTDLFFSKLGVFPQVERFRSPYQNIDIVMSPDSELFYLIFSRYSKRYAEDPEYPKEHWLFLNGDYQLFSGCDELYHEYLVHVPIITNRVPKKVLVLGGGDGLLNRELLKYKDIESITQVDIDPQMIKVARTHPIMRRLNSDSLIDPRVSIKFMDAFYFLKTTKERYDAIFLDFPDPMDYNLSKLYSREFYSFVRKCLKNDGFAAMDAPGSLTVEDWLIYYNTIKASGFRTITPYATVLEEDNPQLDEALRERNIRQKEIVEMLDDLQQGFIMMRKNSDPVDLQYRETGVKMNVLNEKRYQLAFDLPYPMQEAIDWDKVNSIMRPTLPSLSLAHIRLPY